MNLSVVTNSYGRNKETGERKEYSQFHNVQVFGDARIKSISQYLKKGTEVFISGSMETNKSEKDGKAVYFTNVAVRAPQHEIQFSNPRNARNTSGQAGEANGGQSGGSHTDQGSQTSGGGPEMDNEIRF